MEWVKFPKEFRFNDKEHSGYRCPCGAYVPAGSFPSTCQKCGDISVGEYVWDVTLEAPAGSFTLRSLTPEEEEA